MTFHVSGRLGGAISIRITERHVAYEPLHRKRFYAGEWLRMLPPREARDPARYEIQIPEGKLHFGEIYAFNELLKLGYDDAFYERYLVFAAKPATEQRYRLGTEELVGLVGADRYQALRDAAAAYRLGSKNLQAKEPDLLGVRTNADGSREFIAIEAKIDDAVRDDQLLGLALLQRVLGCEIGIWRFRPGDEKKAPRDYNKSFQLR